MFSISLASLDSTTDPSLLGWPTENLLLTHKGPNPEVKIIDFGLSKVLSGSLAKSFLGTRVRSMIHDGRGDPSGNSSMMQCTHA
jgi:hypothetical protein